MFVLKNNIYQYICNGSFNSIILIIIIIIIIIYFRDMFQPG